MLLMKKYTLFLICCLFSLIAAATVSAQGFTGPGSNPSPLPSGPVYNPPPPPPTGGPGAYPPSPPNGGPGFGPPSPPGGSGYGYGFTGPSQTVTVKQAQSYGHKTPVIIKGNIVQALGGDQYTFRDSSGEIVIKIGPREWQYYGATISPQDTIEISGEVCRGNGWEPVHVHARYMKKI